MRVRELLLSFTLPFLAWLLFGAPNLGYQGNLALFGVFVVHLLAVIWSDVVFLVFAGDRFTYGGVALGLNGISVVTTFATTWITLHLGGKHMARVNDISPYAWGIIGLGLLATCAFPILTHRRVTPLAKASDRRAFEDPTQHVG